MLNLGPQLCPLCRTPASPFLQGVPCFCSGSAGCIFASTASWAVCFACVALNLLCSCPGSLGPGGCCQKSQLSCQGDWGMGLHIPRDRPSQLMSWLLWRRQAPYPLAPALLWLPISSQLCTCTWRGCLELYRGLIKDTQCGVSQTCLISCTDKIPDHPEPQFPHQESGLMEFLLQFSGKEPN